ARPLHHAGDLGNVRASGGGARMARIFTDLRLDGLPSVVGRDLVVLEGQDDLLTQPDGGAAAPVACGAVEPVGWPPMRTALTIAVVVLGVAAGVAAGWLRRGEAEPPPAPPVAVTSGEGPPAAFDSLQAALRRTRARFE